MSSLQKFHRRTQSVGPAAFSFTAIGSGDATHGFWLGTAGDGISKLIVAPKITRANAQWGSSGTLRGTISTTNGLTNTNTLYSFGQAAHPAAYYCKTLTTGGYNTWYLPALNELMTCYSNKSTTPFVTNDAFAGMRHWTSTENTIKHAYYIDMSDGGTAYSGTFDYKTSANISNGGYPCTPVRRII